MRQGLNKKRLYLIALILILITLLLLTSMGRVNKEDGENVRVLPEASDPSRITPEPSQTVSAPTMNTVVYYQDDNGYLVPVMRTIKAEEGIAKATLKMMVKSVYNDMEAARLGLRCVIPENTAFDLDISGGIAYVDMSREALSCRDAESEEKMIAGIVQALTDFETVDSVRFRIAGRDQEKLTHGTDISGEFKKGMINLESAKLETGAKTVTLYFTGDSPQMIVPVTRVVYGEKDLQTAVVELVKGPAAVSPLNGVVPPGCGLISAKVTDGVAKIDFTKDFIKIAEETDGGRLALRALVLTCLEFPGIDSVEILVEGEKYDTGEGTLSKPTFVNSADDIYDAFIYSSSELLFDFE
ncbi:MAG: GerMN domain-containing protein [Clostridia bacterium]|nr:GerMN domain-containing protein [Clostridia bacterium]